MQFHQPFGEALRHDRDDLVAVTLELGQRHARQHHADGARGHAAQLHHAQLLGAGKYVGIEAKIFAEVRK